MERAEQSDLVRRYMRAVECFDASGLESFLHPDVEQREHPNKLAPLGATRNRGAMLEGARQGRMVLRSQQLTVLSEIFEVTMRQ